MPVAHEVAASEFVGFAPCLQPLRVKEGQRHQVGGAAACARSPPVGDRALVCFPCMGEDLGKQADETRSA